MGGVLLVVYEAFPYLFIGLFVFFLNLLVVDGPKGSPKAEEATPMPCTKFGSVDYAKYYFKLQMTIFEYLFKHTFFFKSRTHL